MACCEVPCWSGLWLETEEIGYLEISDLDERTHRPPEGWHLVDVKENVFRSSQIFRYVKVPAKIKVSPTSLGGVLAMVGACGTAILGLPFVNAMLTTGGFGA